MVKLTSLRILLAIPAFYNYEVHQGDIKTAYLLGQLTEEIYMEIPEGVSAPTIPAENGNPVCQLLRGLYGLKQSGRIWNKAWDDFLIGKCQFKRSAEDYAVYYRIGHENSPLWTLIWVDDVLWIGKPCDIKEAKQELAARFPLKDLGSAHFFLGMNILREAEDRKITLCQDQYIETILERFGLQDCYSVSTPMEPGLDLTSLQPTQEDSTLYRSMLGSVMYLMLSSGKCRSMVQGGPERSWSTKGGRGPRGPPGPLRSALIHTFGYFTENLDQGGSGWTRRTRGTMTPPAGPGVVFTFC